MDFTPLLEASPAIRYHTLAAVLAFGLGAVVLFRSERDRLHRVGGRIWVGLMAITAVSSFFIHDIRLVGPWSPIHLLSVVALVSLTYGVHAARLRRIAAHRSTMQGLYAGALVIAGGFTFLPGRIMHQVFFGGPSPLIGAAVLAAVTVPCFWMAWRGMTIAPRRERRNA